MAANGFVSRPHERGGTIAMILLAYGQQGGALFAAYRLPDNPLVLSHVRWQGATGEVIEAQHNADEMYSLPQAEREAWAQVALGSATTQADAVGPNAPWLPVRIERERAFELGMRAQRARTEQRAPTSPHLSGTSSGYGSSGYGAQVASNAGAAGSPYGQFPSDASHGMADEYSPTRLIDALPASAPSMPEQPQNTGSWSRDDLLRSNAFPGPAQQEVTVIPCVEVEMPMLLTNEQQDFSRDFARDVAIHFGKAARSIPQTRELRGWMRGARIVLAVRMGFGPGVRPANRAEMEHGAALLSEALARRTLPYAQLRFADPAEWNQGVELPN
ncbi:MAG: hypothetical protein KGO05_10250 [Chloroflexota bacterium]|nr:hypothetical protein [Chloroflexota bacterium]